MSPGTASADGGRADVCSDGWDRIVLRLLVKAGICLPIGLAFPFFATAVFLFSVALFALAVAVA
ncbi:hypothetical protein [Jannaschia marina]|uniref:hypothetical protein n=1 Tax=Jannaschia marina TaxID=2741674 RepID=UPI0015CE53E0|nr:hypothetical protein [Jannaschia marina]